MNFRRLASVLLLAPAWLSAQRYGPIVLRLPAGTRTLAMGNTGVASRDDDVIFFNPAQLAVANGFGASLETMTSTSFSGAVSAVTRFNGTGGVAVGMRFANYGLRGTAFPSTRESMLDGGTLDASSVEASIAGAQVVKGLRVGAALKYAAAIEGQGREDRPLLDVGVSKDLLRSTFGLAVQNIGRDIHAARGTVALPLRTTFGAAQARSIGPYDFVATAAVSVLRWDFVQPSGGIEANYSWLNGYNIALRAGARRPAIGENALTGGAGFTMDRLTMDYTLEALAGGHLGQRFGLRVR